MSYPFVTETHWPEGMEIGTDSEDIASCDPAQLPVNNTP